MISIGTVEFRYYVVIIILVSLGKPEGTKVVEIDQLSMNLWFWSRSVDFIFGFSSQGFFVLYFILSEFLTKDVLECVVNPTYLIGYCDCTLINLVLKTIVLIFYTNHKMDCCEYCYWLTDWGDIIYNAWNRDPLTIHFSVHGRYYLIRYYLMRFSKAWLSERYSLFSRYELLFFSILAFLYFYMIILYIITVYLFVIWFHIDKASEKKRSICVL